jgi:hypothetical protein
MGWRDLLFLGLVGGGAVAFGANLWPQAPKPLTPYDRAAYAADDFRGSVAAVDASFRDSWREQGVEAAATASDLAVARRLAFGLVGATPSLEEIREFEALPAAERLPWYADHLMQDRRWADYFAERLARAYVGTEDGPFILFRRRRLVAWLGDQLAANKPYDVLVRELISGEGLWTDYPATNFITVTCQPEQENRPDPVRLAGRVTRAFLGLRIDCAQCHDHPFADWKQKDFEGMSAFFGQTRLGFTGVHDGQGEYEAEDRKTKNKYVVAPRVPFAADLLPDEGSRRARLAAWVTDARNPFFAKAAVNRVWALMTGRPLADDFTAHGYDLRRLIRLIASTEVFHRDWGGEQEPSQNEINTWAAFPLTRLRPEQVAGAIIQSASVNTIDADSHILVRLIRYGNQNDFLRRYGDSGEDEFAGKGGTIPQRLLLMNGALMHERTVEGPFNASTRIAWLAPDGPHAVESAYLAVLTRRPTPEEAAHFEAFLADGSAPRGQRLEDLYWTLLNSTEFSWNH